MEGVNQTRGLMFSLDIPSKTATVLKDLFDPSDPLFVETQGSFSPLSNGNVFMGYGQVPEMKEYGPAGDVRMSIQFGDLNGTGLSYRAFRVPWEGAPVTVPVVVAESGTAFMSWNGATNVTSWDIYEGLTSSTLEKTGTVANNGFETSSAISNSTLFVQVGAFAGSVFLRNSTVVSVS